MLVVFASFICSLKDAFSTERVVVVVVVNDNNLEVLTLHFSGVTGE
jgi:hypothetical protein